ncbi:hypothetical protein EVAR_25830_1 [Eumeta japonica]|uniref:Integrase zinc-binding domain-containing protein n=1 Tax=Eumeta variegata TaxID=151549 RepID=A0A4C1VU19_EUMVA|nr:hypothetical protein EVAR_25830_1 [Eumeta japonica]
MTKAPPIDDNHPYNRLYVKATHEHLHHGGVEITANEVRQYLWKLRLRNAVYAVIKSCMPCRIRRTTPTEPKIRNLPKARLAYHQRPFTYVGSTISGRMKSSGLPHHRQHHTRFAAHDGQTRGAERNLVQPRHQPPRSRGRTTTSSSRGNSSRGVYTPYSGHFIPPGAPFIGGAWEGMVQSTKRALDATLRERHPTEEVLTTLSLEAEYTVNSRPIPHVSLIADELEALPAGRPRTSTDPGRYLRGRRIQSQAVALQSAPRRRFLIPLSAGILTHAPTPAGAHRPQ